VKRKRILLLLPDNAERRELLRADHARFDVHPCASLKVLKDQLDRTTEALICGTGLGLITEPALLARIESCGVRLVIRCIMTDAAAIELVNLSELVSGFQISVVCHRDSQSLAEGIVDLCSDDPGPVATILRRVADFVPNRALRFVVAALVLGRTRTDVGRYADACGMARRSLQTPFIIQVSRVRTYFSGGGKLAGWYGGWINAD